MNCRNFEHAGNDAAENLGILIEDGSWFIVKRNLRRGECEQFHSEIKTDMDVERLPSGKFDTNELVLELTVLAYNILRLIGQESLKSKRAPKKTSCQKKTYQNRDRESDSNCWTYNNPWATDCPGNWLQ